MLKMRSTWCTDLLFIILAVTQGCLAGNYHIFFGGSISYTLQNQGGTITADIELITGWKLGLGPCGPSCNRNSVGASTKPTRTKIEAAANDTIYFGNFTAEYTYDGDRSITIEKLTRQVHNNFEEKVIAVSETAGWEQDFMKFSFELKNVSKEDLNFDGYTWIDLLQGVNLPWHLQASLYTAIRSDTNEMNNCPQVLAKPFYRVKLNEITMFTIAASDPDGDLVKCELADAGATGSLHNYKGVTVSETCEISIDASASLSYGDDTWVAIAVSVRDYNRQHIMYGDQSYNPFQYSLGLTTLQFAVNVMDNLHVPEFVSPTPEGNRVFIVYANSRWEIEVFAQSPNATTIDDILAIGRNEEIYRKTTLVDSGNRIKRTSVYWIPTSSDVGEHLCCLRAVDNTGVDTSADRCFKLEVRPDLFNYSYSQNTGRPHFINIPSTSQYVDCHVNVTCLVPLYVSSTLALKSIEITEKHTDSAKVGPIEQETVASNTTYKATLSFQGQIYGKQKICLMAFDVDRHQSEEVCINSEILPPDPCMSDPCKHSGKCISDRKSGTFVCQCPNDKYYGRFCEKVRSPCSEKPCFEQNSRHCYDYIAPFYCYCNPGFTGLRCEYQIELCKSDTCYQSGICEMNGTSTICNCFGRYSGDHCQTDGCPSETDEKLICSPDHCDQNTCNGNGVCSAGGVCTCMLGYTDEHCSTEKGIIAVNDTEFVPPTPAEMSEITCLINPINSITDCHLSVTIATTSGSKPSVSVEISKDLNYTVGGVTPATFLKGINNVFTSIIEITGDNIKRDKKFICVTANDGGAKDRRCFEVAFAADNLFYNKSIEYQQRNADVKFVSPTLPTGSRITVYVDQRSTLVLYTTKKTPCKEVLSPMSEVIVFPAQEGTQWCTSEATFTFNITGQKHICFQSAKENFQQRCFVVEVKEANNTANPCSPSPCQNNGLCFPQNDASYKCVCKKNNYGDRCEIGQCPVSNCQNGAYCHTDNGTKTCICPAGFSGTTCGTLLTPGSSDPSFLGTARPIVYQCVVLQPCSMSLLVGATAGRSPTVEAGYVSAGIAVSYIVVEQDQNANGMYKASIDLKPQIVGSQDVCLQTKDQQRVNKDEICVKVEVTADVASVYGAQDKPHFVFPSLPPNAEVLCAAAEPCHMIYTINPGKGNDGKCVSTVPRQDIGIGLYHVFSSCESCSPSTQTQTDNCTVDVSIVTNSSDIGVPLRFCLGVELQESGISGEERCFNLSVVHNETFQNKTGCQSLQCSNDGFCDGHDPNNPLCYCKTGYTGPHCLTKKASVLNSTKPQSFTGDLVVPLVVECVLGQQCVVPLQIITNNQSQPSVIVGYTDPQIVVENPTVSSLSTAGTCTVEVKVHVTTKGTFKACFQAIQNSKVIDEVCPSINVTDAGSPPDKAKPVFVSPTLPKGSMVACSVTATCHFSMHFSKGDLFGLQGKCPSLLDVSSSPVEGIHIFNSEMNNNDCTCDVSYSPGAAGETHEFCVQVVLPGKKGEVRCFNIKTLQDIHSEVPSPCSGFTCNHGRCVAKFSGITATANCICERGYEGSVCDQTVTNITELPGVSALPAGVTGGGQHFDGKGGIPQEITCDTVNPCCMSVPYYGSKDNPPVTSQPAEARSFIVTTAVATPSSDPNYHVAVYCVNGTAGNHSLCLQTTSNGTDKGVNIDEICVVVRIKGGGHSNQTQGPGFRYFPPESQVVCQPNSMCHIEVVDDKRDGVCGQVYMCDNSTQDVHVFQAVQSGDKCITDIAVKTEAAMRDKLCIAGTKGENGEITVVTESKSGFGPCQQLHCINGGKCYANGTENAKCHCPPTYMGTTCETKLPACSFVQCQNDGFCTDNMLTQPVCHCKRGFYGEKCENSSGSALPTGSTQTQSFYGDLVLPTEIVCILREECVVPLQIVTNLSNLSLSFGYKSPGIDIDTPVTTPSGISGTLSATARVHTTAVGTFKACFQILESSKIVDELCLTLDIQAEPSTAPARPQLTFVTPTLPANSTVVCEVSKECHFDMFFSKASNGSCPLLQEPANAQTPGFHVFSSVPRGSNCSSDILYLPSAANNSQRFCTQIGMTGETRCYTVKTVNNIHQEVTSPCIGKTCKNGGRCVASPRNSLLTANCICPHGFESANCDTAVNKSTDLPGVSGLPPNITGSSQHFDGFSGVAKTVDCLSGKPCCVSVPYHGNSQNPPISRYTGLSDVNTTVVTPNTSDPDYHLALVCIKGNPGNHTVCQQTTTNGTKEGVNVDEICFEVMIGTGGSSNQTTGPVFINYPPGSEVLCKTNDICHIPMVYETKSGSCEQVKECGTGMTDVTVFKTTSTGDKCITDIAIKTGSANSTDKLCVSTGSQGEEREITIQTESKNEFGPCQKLHCLNGGSCFQTTTGTAKCHCPSGLTGQTCNATLSACSSIICLNGGFCDDHVPTKLVCICKRGFSGANCENSSSGGLPAGNTKSQSLVGDLALPFEITCILGDICIIPLQIMSNISNPTLAFGYVNPRLDIEQPVVQLSTIPDTFSATATVHTTVEGKFKACFQILTNSKVEDEMCVSVNVQASPAQSSSQLVFVAPTLPADSTVVCAVNKPCYFQMFFSKGPDNLCPELQDQSNRSDAVLHIFPLAFNGDKCSREVTYLPTVTDNCKQICLQVTKTGMSGERRCYKIKVATDVHQEVQSPCVGKICANGGRCVVSVSNITAWPGCTCSEGGGRCIPGSSSLPLASCICSHGFDGLQCEKAVNKTTNLPGVADLPSNITVGNQHFDGLSGVTKTVGCDGDRTCCVSVPYHGDSQHPPITRFTDAGIRLVSSTVINPSISDPDYHIALVCVNGSQGNHTVCQQTTANGTEQSVNIDEICIEVNVGSGGSKNQTTGPVFTNYPPGSAVYCQTNSTCHIPMIYEKKSGSCEQAKECGSGMADVTVFKTINVNDTCITDVAIKTGTVVSSDKLCVSVGSHGEQTEILVQTENKHDFGPCQKYHCLNGGSCLQSSTGNAECHCPTGLTGRTCDRELTTTTKPTTAQTTSIFSTLSASSPASTTTMSSTLISFSTTAPVSLATSADSTIKTSDLATSAPPDTTSKSSNLASTSPVDMTSKTSNFATTSPADTTNKSLNLATTSQANTTNKSLDLATSSPADTTSKSPNLTTHTPADTTSKPSNFATFPLAETTSTASIFSTLSASSPASTPVKLTTTTKATTAQTTSIFSTLSASSPASTTTMSAALISFSTTVTLSSPADSTSKASNMATSASPDTISKSNLATSSSADTVSLSSNMATSSSADTASISSNMETFTPANMASKSSHLSISTPGQSTTISSYLLSQPTTDKRNTTAASKVRNSSLDNCTKQEAASYARKIVSSGYASCFCVVNGKRIDIIKKRPVVPKTKVYTAAGFGAGGMAGSMIAGGVIYAIVNRLRQPVKPSEMGQEMKKQQQERKWSPRDRGRVNPEPVKANPKHVKNIMSF